MQNTQLIQLLQTLSVAELRQFRDYVASPFFNKNQKVRQLTNWLYRHAPDFTHEQLSKKNAFTELFGVVAYNRLPINNVISDLLQLLTNFLAYQAQAQQPLQQVNHQIKALQNRSMPKLAANRIRRFEQLNAATPLADQTVFYEEYRFYENLDYRFLMQQKRGYDQHLQLANDKLDAFYVTTKLKIACDMYSRNTIVDAAYECHFKEAILEWIANNDFKINEIAAAKVYHQIYLMLNDLADTQHYFELRELLTLHEHIFPKTELAGIYTYVLNYCIKQINFGKAAFDQEILALYKLLLQKALLYKNEVLTQWTFRNIVTIAIRNQDFVWADTFINNYQKRLQKEYRDNEVKYNSAALYFAQKNYAKALQRLQQVTFTDNFHQIGAKTIQLKCYFELQETEAFLSLTSAFSRYLRRHRQLSDYHKKLNMNFVKMTKKVYMWRENKPAMRKVAFKKKQQELQEQLSNMELIANQSWLVGQLRG